MRWLTHNRVSCLLSEVRSRIDGKRSWLARALCSQNTHVVLTTQVAATPLHQEHCQHLVLSRAQSARPTHRPRPFPPFPANSARTCRRPTPAIQLAVPR